MDKDDGPWPSPYATGLAIETGAISSRAVMVQVLVLPATLATGMVVIGLIFAMGL